MNWQKLDAEVEENTRKRVAEIGARRGMAYAEAFKALDVGPDISKWTLSDLWKG